MEINSTHVQLILNIKKYMFDAKYLKYNVTGMWPFTTVNPFVSKYETKIRAKLPNSKNFWVPYGV